MLEDAIKVAQIAGASTTFLNALLFFWLNAVPKINPGIKCWAIGLLLSFCGFIVFNLPEWSILGIAVNEYIYFTTECFLSVCMFIGVRLFIGKKVNRMLFIGLSCGASLVLIVLGIGTNNSIFYFGFISIFNGIFIVATGLNLYAHDNQDNVIHSRIVAGILIIWGIHWLDAPFLMRSENLSAYGFFIALLLSNLAFLGYASLMVRMVIQEVKTLRGFIPICSNCKNIRDDEGYWEKIEKYIQERSDAMFTHSICPECIKKLYPDIAEVILEKRK